MKELTVSLFFLSHLFTSAIFSSCINIDNENFYAKNPYACVSDDESEKGTALSPKKRLRLFWEKDQDTALINAVNKTNTPTNLINNWTHVATLLQKQGIRCSGKQCRERYTNHLDPKIIRADLTEEEIHEIDRLRQIPELNGKWTQIADEISKNEALRASLLKKNGESIKGKIRKDYHVKNYVHSNANKIRRCQKAKAEINCVGEAKKQEIYPEQQYFKEAQHSLLKKQKTVFEEPSRQHNAILLNTQNSEKIKINILTNEFDLTKIDNNLFNQRKNIINFFDEEQYDEEREINILNSR